MKFSASVVEVYEDDEIGVITVHFDDESDAYLQFQGSGFALGTFDMRSVDNQ